MLKTVSFSSVKDNYDPVLDSLRGAGCLVVYIFHSSLVQGSAAHDFFFKGTGIALPLFFLFSSCLLVSANMRPQGFTWVDTKRFYINRFFRIFPTWWFFLIVSYIYVQPDFKYLIANALMYFGFIPFDEKYNYTIIGWSLFAEEFYYWFFPLWIMLIRNLKRALLSTLIGFLIFIVWSKFGQDHPIETNPHWYTRFPLNFIHIFLFGFVVYFLKENISIKKALVNPKIVFTLDLLLLITLAKTSLTFYYFIPVVLIMVLVQNPLSLLRKFLSGPISVIFKEIGVVCYSFYLFHVLVIGMTHSNHYLSQNLWLKLFVDGILTWLVAKIVYEFVEKPSHLLGRRILSRSTQ